VAKQPKYDGIRPDVKNANKGTERGRYMVEASLRETGAGRSILLDKDGRIIAGNKTFEAASDIGLPVRVVETDGTELVAVKRTDLDLDDDTGTARKLDLNSKDGSVTFKDNETGNTVAWGADVKLPDDFPKELPVYPDAKIVAAAVDRSDASNASTYVLSVSDAPKVAVAWYETELKFQGTADFPDALLIGDSTARISLVASSSGKSFQLTQATGASVSTSHSTASGLTTIALGTDALGRGNVTPAALVAYIAANLSATFTGTAIATGGVMGAMDRAVAVPISPRWIDLESTRQDTSTTAFEHTLDPGAGGSATYGFRVKSQGWRAVRAIACSSGAPDTADSIAVTMGLPG
jgi:hypothetical protein